MPVLIADDNATSRAILEEMIENWRMKPVPVPDGHAALEALKQGRTRRPSFPACAARWTHAEADGIRRCRPNQKRSHAQAHGGDFAHGRDAPRRCAPDAERCGRTATVSKPVKQSELWDAVATVLHSKSRTEATSGADRPCRKNANQTASALQILLAEDNAVNQQLAVQLLEEARTPWCGGKRREAVDAVARKISIWC